MTSGVWRSWVDTLIQCRCGYVGWIEACEDREDQTTSWECPGCEHPEVERWGDDFQDD